METIDLTQDRAAVEVAGKVTVCGAIKRETSTSTEDDPRYWYAIRFQDDNGEGDVLQAFCEADIAAEAAKRLKSDGRYLADVVLRLSSGNRGTTLNVDSLA